MSDKIKVVKGEQFLLPVTVKRAGSTVDLTTHEAAGLDAAKLYVRTASDNSWDVVDGQSAESYPDAANGVVRFLFQASSTASISHGGGKGEWRVLLNDGEATPTIEYTDKGPFEVELP